jgi:hypothetical protein
MAFRLTTDKVAAPKFKQNLAGLQGRFEKAFTAALNMAASMIKDQAKADIQNAGNFGSRYTDGLSVTVENMRISMSLEAPGAEIFEKGGTIQGNPLLWIPISGTDAVGTRARDYGGKLFSVNRKSGGVPLLFSVADKQPKYFGTESVTIPQKFHLKDTMNSVMGNFRSIFDAAFRATE